MPRQTGTKAAAVRRRTKHEHRINNEINPLRRLELTWSWVHAEARRHPHRLNDLQTTVHALGVDLNNVEATPDTEGATR